ncbi:MAG TPA: glycosyltransferase [Candidatus Paceibacterota bacterium]|nr:glycosyltransferase [Candidatus Paceibacterota bacterium]
MANKKRIIFTINDFAIGGAQRVYLDLFSALPQDAYELHLVTFFEFPEYGDMYRFLPPHVSVHRYSFRGFMDIRSWYRLARDLRHLKPRLAVSSLFFSNTVMRVLGIFLGTPVVPIEHNTYSKKTRLQIAVDTLLARWSPAIVAVSSTVAQFTAEQERIPEEKFRVIHNGVNTEQIAGRIPPLDARLALRAQLGFRAEEKVIVNVARLTPQKNQMALIAAFEKFVQSHSDYRLLLIGPGPMYDDLARRIVQGSASGKIVLLGGKTDVIPYYCISEFFVSASLIEGFGLAHAEALACGIPVLTTRTAGPDEMIVDGVNGYFIKDTTIEEIVAGLEKMVQRPIIAAPETLRASIEKYSIEAMASRYASLINEFATS